MHATTAVFDPTLCLESWQQFPHPNEPDAMLAFVAPDGDATGQSLLQITKVVEPAARKKLIELAVLLTSVRHPNLVTLRDVRVDGGALTRSPSTSREFTCRRTSVSRRCGATAIRASWSR